jgi:hypothetical protein
LIVCREARAGIKHPSVRAARDANEAIADYVDTSAKIGVVHPIRISALDCAVRSITAIEDGHRRNARILNSSIGASDEQMVGVREPSGRQERGSCRIRQIKGACGCANGHLYEDLATAIS